MRYAFAVLLSVVLSGVMVAYASDHRRSVFVLDDPADDDRGPGGYLYPSGSEFRPGDFDIRSFEVVVDGDMAEFRVTLGAAIDRHVTRWRTNASEIRFENALVVQNVDIYIDRDPRPGIGHTQSLPGRRISFRPEQAWEVAIVLTPQPYPTRSVLDEAMGDSARSVLVPDGLRSSGATVFARIPIVQLGDVPKAQWGYMVAVSGALWDRDFDVTDRIRGTHEANAFTMPVVAVPEKMAFGGGELGRYHPQVIDVLVPPGESQYRLLGSYDTQQGQYATLPMVYPDSAGVPAKQQKRKIDLAIGRTNVPESYVVQDVVDDMLVITTPMDDLGVYRIGEVVNESGKVKARVVVNTVKKGFVVALVVQSNAPIEKGDVVRFNRQISSEKKEESNP